MISVAGRGVQALVAVTLMLALSGFSWTEEFPDPENAAAERQFGLEATRPINKGFLFIDSLYVHAPYVVARRGLSVYINDHFIEQAFTWPGPVHEVLDDPGDPVIGSSPFDVPRSPYWERKWIYLSSHNDITVAREKMVEIYWKADFATAIEPSPRIKGAFRITRKDGKISNVGLNDNWKREIIPDDYMLKTAKEMYKRYEKTLLDNQVIGALSQGGYWEINTPLVPAFFTILLSQDDPAKKRQQLIDKQLLLTRDDDVSTVMLAIIPDDDLKTRVSFLLGDSTASKPPDHAAPVLPQPSVAASTPAPSEVAGTAAPVDGSTSDRQRHPVLLWLIISVVASVIIGGGIILSRKRR